MFERTRRPLPRLTRVPLPDSSLLMEGGVRFQLPESGPEFRRIVRGTVYDRTFVKGTVYEETRENWDRFLLGTGFFELISNV